MPSLTRVITFPSTGCLRVRESDRSSSSARSSCSTAARSVRRAANRCCAAGLAWTRGRRRADQGQPRGRPGGHREDRLPGLDLRRRERQQSFGQVRNAFIRIANQAGAFLHLRPGSTFCRGEGRRALGDGCRNRGTAFLAGSRSGAYSRTPFATKRRSGVATTSRKGVPLNALPGAASTHPHIVAIPGSNVLVVILQRLRLKFSVIYAFIFPPRRG
jgi:hypothetical protein